MSQIIEILTSLGINKTVFLQFAVFFFAYISMSFIVFKPYLRAYEERIKRTVGGQQEAEELLARAAEKEELYKQEAKKLNKQIRETFAEMNSKAKKETEEILQKAKAKADAELETSRKEMESSIQQARKEMESHLPEISQNIQKKFMGQNS